MNLQVERLVRQIRHLDLSSFTCTGTAKKYWTKEKQPERRFSKYKEIKIAKENLNHSASNSSDVWRCRYFFAISVDIVIHDNLTMHG